VDLVLLDKNNSMEKLLSLFEKYLLNNLPNSKTFHPYFEDALADMLKAGGKRFRPMLLLSVVKSNKSLLIANSLPIALGLEFLHTYSLIHDDLPAMDNADLRRGFQTLHKKYDEVTAILVGDALNTEAFNLISNASLSNDIKIDLIKCLASNGGINGMIIGQAIDCYFENQKLELNQLEFLHIHKTAKLIAASLKMGAIISEYDLTTQEKLYNFGIDLGLLFQIQDDIIDETCTSAEAGKTTQNDASKNSFVNLLGLNGARKSADELASKCTNILNTFDENLKLSLEELLLKYINRHK
jgi:geranylgeranyl diphosphate synthase, type II